MENIISTELVQHQIVAYGHPVLRTSCSDIEIQSAESELLLAALWSVLESSGGVGLAAPQINSPKKAFVVDTKFLFDELPDSKRKTLFLGDDGIRESFINARILASSEELWKDPEACLSIPGISEYVERPWEIILEYYDSSMNLQRKQFAGYTAKVIQHEFDHTKGILFIDHVTALKKKIFDKKLKQIKAGKLKTAYPIKYLKA